MLAADVEVLSGQASQRTAADRSGAAHQRRRSGERRKHLLSLFTVAGPDDPAVATARRALASALF